MAIAARPTLLMRMESATWETEFRHVWDRAVVAWRAGRTAPATMFSAVDVKFLAGIGCSAQELFDFVDDYQRYGEPDFATTLAVTAIRRDYFLHTLGGKATGFVASMDDLPAKSAAIQGIAWLPRLIVKARLKLRGEMPADLMYGCGGDRPFLRRMKTDLPSFLKLVRECGDDDQKIVTRVKKQAGIS